VRPSTSTGRRLGPLGPGFHRRPAYESAPMLTTLSKPLRRRVGKLVVTITAEGVELRKYRGRRKRQFSWDELGASADPPASGREAFERSLPQGWVPKVGDMIWSRRRGYCPRLATVLAVIPAVPEPCFKISFGKSVAALELPDLRPC